MIASEYQRRRSVIENSKYYRECKVNANENDFGSTKVPSGLAAMTLAWSLITPMIYIASLSLSFEAPAFMQESV